MARKAPKNPINDIVDTVGAWLGGNRGSVPSSGAGAAWQASARSAAQSANRRIVKGVEEGVVQFGALGMGTSAQTQRDLMYGVSGAGTRAAKEASVSQVTGLAAGAVAAKAAQVAGRAVAKTGIPARVANKVTGQVVGLHGSPVKGLTKIKPIGPTERAWAANPSTGVQKATNVARDYSGSNRGSLYVVKVSKKNLASQSTDLTKSPTFGSPQPLKVVQEINQSGFPFDPKEAKAIKDALKKAGFKPSKNKK